MHRDHVPDQFLQFFWGMLPVTGEEGEIDVETPGGGAHPAEFDKWRWEELEKLPDLIVPFKRDAYLQVVDAFRKVPAGLRG